MDLSKIYLFQNLTSTDLENLKKISKIVNFKKKNILFYEKDKPKYLYILIEGIVKVYKQDSKNKEIVLHNFYPISMIAELANLENIPYPATAEFESDGKILAIDFKEFEKSFLNNPKVSTQIIKSLTKKIKNLEKVIDNLTMDSNSKIAKFIYENEELFFELKSYKIASILNITPETLSRVVRKLKNRDILNSERVLDRDELEKLF